MALLKSFSRIAQISAQNARICAYMGKRGYAAEAQDGMRFTFATPSESFYNEAKISQVDVCSLSGDFGILAQHVPTLAALKPGVITVHAEDGQAKYFVSSGTVTVNSDSSVQILAEEAVPVDRLDMAAIKSGLASAQQEASSASTEKAKAEAQIAVECYEALEKAAM